MDNEKKWNGFSSYWREKFGMKKSKNKKDTRYDSKLEERLHGGPFKNLEHHPSPVAYEVRENRTYKPDFIYHLPFEDIREGESNGNGEPTVVLIEAKGYFRDRAEAKKYLHLRASLPVNYKILFVFQDKHKQIHWQTKKKDGTKMTHAEWAEKNGFDHVDEEEIKHVLPSDAFNDLAPIIEDDDDDED